MKTIVNLRLRIAFQLKYVNMLKLKEGVLYDFWFMMLFILILVSILVFTGCSVEGFKDFKVKDISIDDNGVIGVGRDYLRVVFNKEVDRDSAYDSIRIEEEGGTQVSFDIKIDGAVAIITPDENWKPHKRYWLIIDKDIEDIYGKKMENFYYLSFKSTIEAMPVSAVVITPLIEKGIVSDISNHIEVAFSDAVNKASMERAFSISPEVKGAIHWLSDRSFMYNFNEKLSKNSFYTVSISDNGLDLNGYPVKEFTREFEYFPNTEYPEIDTLLIDAVLIYDRNDPDSYRIEDDNICIDFEEAEKSPVIRVNFTTSMEKLTLEDGFEISPSSDWQVKWIDGNTADISFNEDLKLEKSYKLKFSKSIKNCDGLGLVYNYLINVGIYGQYSRHLNFYTDDFLNLSIDATLTSNGNSILLTGLSKGEDDDGYYIRVSYNDTPSPEEIDVNLDFLFRFLSDYYTPSIEEDTLQDGTNLSFVLGTNAETSSKTGNIEGYNWITNNECHILVGEIGTDNVYHLHSSGGAGGVMDEHRCYLKNDIDFYFKLIVEKD